MEARDVFQSIFQYGGTVVMAFLFVWVFIQDKTKNNKMLEDNTQMLKVLTESNNNIAKSLDIIATNLVTIDSKVDRNYQETLKERRKE